MINYNSDKSFIVVTFIKMKNLSVLRKAMATLPRGIETISYLEIYNKLAKKEDKLNEPSEALISTYIIKQLNTLLSDENTSHLCYVLDTTDNDIYEKLANIMEFIVERSERNITFEMISDNEDIINQTKKLNINSKKI